MRTGPDYIQFYPTLRCNRSCDFCFNRRLPDCGDMGPVDFKTMLDVLEKAGVRTLDIMGGEPTMHADIVSFIADALGCGFKVNISSNGSDLSVLEKIIDAGTQVTVGISINDRKTLRQVSGFIRTHAPVVKSLYGPALDTGMVQTILSLGPKRFYLIYRDAMDPRELKDTSPFHEFVAAVQQRFDSRSVGTVFCSGFLPDLGDEPGLAHVRCPAGTTKLGVMPDGSVYPCNLFFGNKDFLLGNILTDPFNAIWNSPALSFFRKAGRAVCPQTSCRLQAGCHGGCPAIGLLLAADLAAPDPRCAPHGPFPASRHDNLV
jgi:radical SAM protein with 4Fe4S-binding SPASM domain